LRYTFDYDNFAVAPTETIPALTTSLLDLDELEPPPESGLFEPEDDPEVVPLPVADDEFDPTPDTLRFGTLVPRMSEQNCGTVRPCFSAVSASRKNRCEDCSLGAFVTAFEDDCKAVMVLP
jgi:hypothetical protein